MLSESLNPPFVEEIFPAKTNTKSSPEARIQKGFSSPEGNLLPSLGLSCWGNSTQPASLALGQPPTHETMPATAARCRRARCCTAWGTVLHTQGTVLHTQRAVTRWWDPLHASRRAPVLAAAAGPCAHLQQWCWGRWGWSRFSSLLLSGSHLGSCFTPSLSTKQLPWSNGSSGHLSSCLAFYLGTA